MIRRTITILVLLICAILLLTFLPQSILRIVYPRKYEDLIFRYAKQYSVPEEIVFAVIKTESNFDPDAVSSAGAVGLMQIMPSTFLWLTEMKGESLSPSMLTDPETNIRYGVFFLHYLYEYYGDYQTAFAAYNAGMGNVSNWLVSEQYSENGKLVRIPFAETSNYVRLVSERTRLYKKLYD